MATKPLLERTFDAQAVAAVMNDESVRPYIGPGPKVLDPTLFLSDTRNIALWGQFGGHLYAWQAPGIYEVHTQYLPAGRGKYALRAARESVFWMFAYTDCMEILTRVQTANRRAEKMAFQCGFQPLFEQENRPGWGPMKYLRLDYHRWVNTDAALPEIGHWFHERLEATRGTPPNHDDDAAHDRYVGATTAMILRGNVAKGIITYNRWARLAGYCQLKVMQDDPLRLDVGDGIIEVANGTFTGVETWLDQS